MKILINTVDLPEGERIYPGYAMPEGCFGAKLIVRLNKNYNNEEKLEDAMYVVARGIKEIEGVEACEFWRDRDQDLVVVFNKKIDWLCMAKAIENNLCAYRKTKHLVLEFQFESLLEIHAHSNKFQ